METTIFRTLKCSQIKKLFNNHSDRINILFYSPCVKHKNFDEQKRYKFRILIRHNEKYDAKGLFESVFAEVFAPKKAKNTNKSKIKAHVLDMLKDSQKTMIAKLETALNSGAIDVEGWNENNMPLIVPKSILIALFESEAAKYDAKNTSFAKEVKKNVRNLRYFI